MMTASAPEPSLARLLLRALLELGWIALLIGPATQLAPLAALAGWCLLLSAEWAFDHWRGGVPYRLQQAQFFWMVGSVIAVGRWPDNFWLGLPLAFGTGIAALYVQNQLERRLRLLQQAPTALQVPPTDTPAAQLPRGSSAWGSETPLLTPEGERVRCFEIGEIAMGGPVVCDYLLPDGSLITQASPSARFSSDGRHFVSPMPSRGAWGLLIFDRWQRRLYRCSCSEFWELDHVSDTTIHGRYSPLTSDAVRQASLEALKAEAESETLHPLADLWLPEHLWQRYHDRLQPKTLSAPDAPHLLIGQPCLPESLRTLDDPIAVLHAPALALHLDGQDCGLFMRPGDGNLAWRADGQALVVRATATAENAPAYWYWQSGSDWRRLGMPWQRLDQEPYCLSGGLLSVDASHAHLDLELAQPRLSQHDWGELNGYTHASLELTSAYAEDGRPCTREAGQPRLEILLPLDGATGRSACTLRSTPLPNGQHATWRWLHDDRDGTRGAYALSLGDWQLEGQWTLDHRLSDCGRYLALVSFAEEQQIAQLAIADTHLRTLARPDTTLAEIQLMGFIDGQIHLVHLLGLRHETDFRTADRHHLPRQLDQCLPVNPADWRDFARPRDGMRQIYAHARVTLDGQAWRVQSVRLASQPPAAWWQGDFILSAPGDRDHAWAFGFERDRVTVADEWREFARDGYLLTASGIGLANLAAPMIWSDDGRYLALLRHVDRLTDSRLESAQWRLLLLDTEERSLRSFGDDMGLWPRFEHFAGDLCYSNLSASQEHAQRRVIRLKDLLQVRAEPLEEHAGRWLSNEERHRAQAWAKLPLPPLNQ